jgi:hypothetical protein
MDYYLRDTGRLNGQPKKTIADYVEQNGILVPRRFMSLEEAKSSGLPVIARSEHPLEYAHFSGLLDSPDLDRLEKETGVIRDEDEIKHRILADANKPNEKRMHLHSGYLLPSFCKLAGIEPRRAIRQLSFSLWEKLPGLNQTIFADSAIKGRYHVLEFRFPDFIDKSSPYASNYFVIEGGKIIRKNVNCRGFTEKTDFSEMIALYENVRNLPNFDPNNCPIIEVQEVDGKNYFLQYHRGRDFKSAEFDLNSPTDEGEEVLFVRGVTPKEGVSGMITTAYASQWGNKNFSEWATQAQEFGSFDFHYNWAFSNLMYPRRKVQAVITSYKQNVNWELMKYSSHHANVSELAIPEVSIIVDQSIFREPIQNEGGDFEKSESLRLGRLAKQTGKDQGIMAKIISDGRRAYIKRLD